MVCAFSIAIHFENQGNNFQLARKTKCDGLHPSCSSCARRSLDCQYANESSNASGRRKNAVAAAQPISQTNSQSSQTPSKGSQSRMQSPVPIAAANSGNNNFSPTQYAKIDRRTPSAEPLSAPSFSYKRIFVEDGDNIHPTKRYRSNNLRPDELDVRSGREPLRGIAPSTPSTSASATVMQEA